MHRDLVTALFTLCYHEKIKLDKEIPTNSTKTDLDQVIIDEIPQRIKRVIMHSFETPGISVPEIENNLKALEDLKEWTNNDNYTIKDSDKVEMIKGLTEATKRMLDRVNLIP
jgi:hypothetical protein